MKTISKIAAMILTLRAHVGQMERINTRLRKQNAELAAALQRLVDLYVLNQGTPSEFIACVTPKGAWELSKAARRRCRYWRAFDIARKLLGRRSVK